MPFILAAVLAFIPVILKRVIALLGITLVTYVGLDFLVTQTADFILSRYNNLGTDVLAIMDLAGIHIAINMLLATWAGIAALQIARKTASVAFGIKS